jgi:hypothetical protein
MKHPNNLSFSEPAKGPIANGNTTTVYEIPGFVFHPVRRASDNCPISRMGFAAEFPPTSPKIHELRERNAAQQAADHRLRSRLAK